MGRLEGQVVLVTGGASGLGRAIVDRFVAEGARVGVLDRSHGRLDAVSASHGAAVSVILGDVRSLADNQAAVRACEERFGALDCAIGNAGLWDHSAALVDLPDEQIDAAFDELFQVNVKGVPALGQGRSPRPSEK